MISEYRYKFDINISHSNESTFEKKHIHSHNISITVFVINNEQEFILYDEIEDTIKSYIEQFNKRYINGIKPFDKIIPTIENIGMEFYRNLKIILGENNYILTRLEISEIPTRTYIINGEG